MTSSIISKTCKFVENRLAGDGSGHDWWHIFRVWTLAKKIAVEEKAQLETVELGALLHDIADWKFHGGDDSIGPTMAQEFLNKVVKKCLLSSFYINYPFNCQAEPNDANFF